MIISKFYKCSLLANLSYVDWRDEAVGSESDAEKEKWGQMKLFQIKKSEV